MDIKRCESLRGCVKPCRLKGRLSGWHTLPVPVLSRWFRPSYYLHIAKSSIGLYTDLYVLMYSSINHSWWISLTLSIIFRRGEFNGKKKWRQRRKPSAQITDVYYTHSKVKWYKREFGCDGIQYTFFALDLLKESNPYPFHIGKKYIFIYLPKEIESEPFYKSLSTLYIFY